MGDRLLRAQLRAPGGEPRKVNATLVPARVGDSLQQRCPKDRKDKKQGGGAEKQSRWRRLRRSEDGTGPTSPVSAGPPREGQHSGRPAPGRAAPLPTIYEGASAAQESADRGPRSRQTHAGGSSARAREEGSERSHRHAGCQHRAVRGASARRGAHKRGAACGQLQTPRGACTLQLASTAGAGPDTCCGGPSDEPNTKSRAGRRTQGCATALRAPGVGNAQPCDPAKSPQARRREAPPTGLRTRPDVTATPPPPQPRPPRPSSPRPSPT